MTLYPIGYSAQMVTMDELRAVHEPHMHAEYARRLFAWLESEAGHVGIGGGYRPPGTQPPGTPGFAPPGKSFHEGQTFASGVTAYCAVDLVVVVPGTVHRAPYWSEVPGQDSQWAATWGVHANVPDEPWHMQPTEIDGWDSWANTGRRDPVAGYPIPGNPTPTPTPPAGQPVTVTLPTLEEGDTGEHVQTAQMLMSARGVWSDTAQNHDSVFGSGTAQYVRTFQTSRGLNPDGVIGPLTWAALLTP